MNRLCGVFHHSSWADRLSVTLSNIVGESDIGLNRERYHACKERMLRRACPITDVVDAMCPSSLGMVCRDQSVGTELLNHSVQFHRLFLGKKGSC